jgi:hypothetical protein
MLRHNNIHFYRWPCIRDVSDFNPLLSEKQNFSGLNIQEALVLSSVTSDHLENYFFRLNLLTTFELDLILVNMDNEKTVREWQRNIIAICEDRLGRELTICERKFILSPGGFMALEVIEDSVSEGSSDQIERLLNSESN